MNQEFWALARRFFAEIVSTCGPAGQARIGVLTHLLPDRPALLSALGELGRVEWVVPVRYSEYPGVAEQLAQLGIDVRRPPQDEAWPPPEEWFQHLLRETLESDHEPFVLYEIGGYFASAVAAQSVRPDGRLLGVVEDTEAGHRMYAEQQPLAVPVYSVARSPLKAPEDVLVGESIAYSVEAVLRILDRPIPGIDATVLGYGSVGSSTARALASRGARVAVWDSDPAKRISALAAGFSTPIREVALRRAELVVGTSGSVSLDHRDLRLLRANCVLASGSSRQAEFALGMGDRRVIAKSPLGVPLIEQLRTEAGNDFYLAYSGFPVNFADGASIGPFLQLSQAEILAAVSSLVRRESPPGLQEVPPDRRAAIAACWTETYLGPDGALVSMVPGDP